MSNTVVLYGSTTGNTESMAEMIAKKLEADVFNVDSFDVSQLDAYKNILLGSSTWGIGDLQDDWESFLDPFSKASLKDKTIAIFGTGDSSSYDDSFVDAIGLIYDAIKDSGAKIVGSTDIEGYDFAESKAVVDGKFVGLPLDEDNESEKSEERIDNWLKSIENDLQK